MKKLDYFLMVFTFVIAGLSAVMWYGKGLSTWIWQICCMLWIAVAYIKQKRLDRFEK